MSRHSNHHFRLRSSRSGVALIIVLAFVVLLTAVIVAFFSRAMNDRGISNNSANQTKADLFAQGAANSIIGNLKQEIVLSSSNSTPITAGGVTTTIYNPLALPQMSGTTAAGVTNWAPNLLIRSASNQNFYSGGTSISANAVPANSLTPSLNGRYVSQARWNAHYLLPLAANATDSTPDPTTFAPPDWILVARDGSNPSLASKSVPTSIMTSSNNSSSVVGRYAYAIYHEGGLLDVNAVGYPMTGGSGAATNSSAILTGSQTAYKNSLAFADLTQLPGISSLSASQQQNFTYNLVGWRNYASAQAGSSFPNLTFSSGAPYDNFVLSNSSGSLKTSGTSLWNGQSDRMFASRQELIQFVQSLPGLSGTNLDVLNYLATFTRDLNQPSYIRPQSTNSSSTLDYNANVPQVLPKTAGGNSAGGLGVDDQINPSFPAVRVVKAFARNDGTQAVVGDPLVLKRFALSRLAWLTYMGPSSTRNYANPSSSGADADIWTIENKYGITASFLQQGTSANIQKYFGLQWNAGVWIYNVHNGAAGSGSSGSIMRLGGASGLAYLGSPREPDFFELLKAALNVGSLGKAVTNSSTAVAANPYGYAGYAQSEIPENYRYAKDSSVDYQIMQIGANIINQSRPDSYPIRIIFNDGSQDQPNGHEFDGVTDLPYLNFVVNGVLRVEQPATPQPNSYSSSGGANAAYPAPIISTDPTNGMLSKAGTGVFLQVPVLWNAYDISGSNGLTGLPRPTNFRILVDSTDPLTLANGGTYHKIVAAGAAYDIQGNSQLSYNATSTGLQPSNSTLPKFYYASSGGATPLTAATTELDFTDGSGTAGGPGSLFREPTILFRKGGLINLSSPVYTSGITGIDPNPLYGDTTDAAGSSYLGIILGAFPLRFQVSTSGTTYTLTSGEARAYEATNMSPLFYLTYRVQCPDPNNSGSWITYDTKYGRTTNGISFYAYGWNGATPPLLGSPTVGQPSNLFQAWTWSGCIDPRSARFGLYVGGASWGCCNFSPCNPPVNGDSSTATYGWIDPVNGICQTQRPDAQSGYLFCDFDSGSYGLGSGDGPYADVPFPQNSAGWSAPVVHGYGGVTRADFCLGIFSQNNPGVPFYIQRATGLDLGGNNDEFGTTTRNPQPGYYADADGVVRRGMGAYVLSGSNMNPVASAGTTVGLPQARAQNYATATAPTSPPSYIVGDPTQSLNQAQSRSLFLHRPFRSVAELGYVFRDTPWKNIDFSTPESGDTALLDVFCLNDSAASSGLVAGKVNLNTRQAPVITAILNAACVDDPKVSNATVGSLSPSLAQTIANALLARTGTAALQNPAELVGKWQSTQRITPPVTYIPTNTDLGAPYMDGRLSYLGFSGGTTVSSSATDLVSAYSNASFASAALQQSMIQVKRMHEAPIRALASVGQTRVWNLLIDVVAQTGRYPQSASTLDNFLVEGEERLWVHVAIDRLTGQVLDKQVEVVKQ